MLLILIATLLLGACTDDPPEPRHWKCEELHCVTLSCAPSDAGTELQCVCNDGTVDITCTKSTP